MDDRDLDLLRTFRAADAIPPVGFEERLEEDLLQVVLDEELGRPPRPATPLRPERAAIGNRIARWIGASALARPALAGVAAIALATGVAVLSDGGATSAGTSATGGGVAQASTNVFDATATALFGGGGSSTDARAAVNGSPTLGAELPDAAAGSDDERAALLAQGPGTSQAEALQRATQLPASEAKLRDLLRRASDGMRSSAAGGSVADDGDRIAFHLGMRWVVDPLVPATTRAAILRSLAGFSNIDRAVRGQDLLGRAGIVLSHYDERSGLREQYVLDPDGGDLLERRAFTTAYMDPACPPGTFTSYALFERGTSITADQVPWIDWPATIDSCDPSDLSVG